jgi:hypothetical protein
MQIKHKSDLVIELIGEKGKAAFLYPGATPVKEEGVNNVGFVTDPNVIYRPGEYEVAEISVFALETKAEPNGTADIFALNVDGVTLLFMGNEKYNLKKDQRDLVSKVDVIVLNLNLTKEIDGLINKVEAGAVVVINFDSPEQASEVTELSAGEVASKIKFETQDFADEEAAVILHLLSK